MIFYFYFYSIKQSKESYRIIRRDCKEIIDHLNLIKNSINFQIEFIVLKLKIKPFLLVFFLIKNILLIKWVIGFLLIFNSIRKYSFHFIFLVYLNAEILLRIFKVKKILNWIPFFHFVIFIIEVIKNSREFSFIIQLNDGRNF